MEDHNMGMARKKLQKQQQQQYKQPDKQTKKTLKECPMILPTTQHSSLLRIFIIDNPAALSRSFLH